MGLQSYRKKKKNWSKTRFYPSPLFSTHPCTPYPPPPWTGYATLWHCRSLHAWLTPAVCFVPFAGFKSVTCTGCEASKHEQAMLVQGRFLVNCVHWVKALAVGEMCWRVVFALLYTGNGEAKVFWFSFHSYWCIQARVKTSFHDFDVTCINCSFISLIMNDLATNKYNCKYNDSIKLDPGNLKSRGFE